MAISAVFQFGQWASDSNRQGKLKWLKTLEFKNQHTMHRKIGTWKTLDSLFLLYMYSCTHRYLRHNVHDIIVMHSTMYTHWMVSFSCSLKSVSMHIPLHICRTNVAIRLCKFNKLATVIRVKKKLVSFQNKDYNRNWNVFLSLFFSFSHFMSFSAFLFYFTHIFHLATESRAMFFLYYFIFNSWIVHSFVRSLCAIAYHITTKIIH